MSQTRQQIIREVLTTFFGSVATAIVLCMVDMFIFGAFPTEFFIKLTLGIFISLFVSAMYRLYRLQGR